MVGIVHMCGPSERLTSHGGQQQAYPDKRQNSPTSQRALPADAVAGSSAATEQHGRERENAVGHAMTVVCTAGHRNPQILGKA